MGIEQYKTTMILSKVLKPWQIDPEIMPNFAVAIYKMQMGTIKNKKISVHLI